MDNGFEEFVESIKKKGYKIECPVGCSLYGFLCSGNPYETPCSSSYIVDSDGNEVGFEEI